MQIVAPQAKKSAALAPVAIVEELKIPQTFHSFSMYYFQNYRLKKVGAQTYKTDRGGTIDILNRILEKLQLCK